MDKTINFQRQTELVRAMASIRSLAEIIPGFASDLHEVFVSEACVEIRSAVDVIDRHLIECGHVLERLPLTIPEHLGRRPVPAEPVVDADEAVFASRRPTGEIAIASGRIVDVFA